MQDKLEQYSGFLLEDDMYFSSMTTTVYSKNLSIIPREITEKSDNLFLDLKEKEEISSNNPKFSSNDFYTNFLKVFSIKKENDFLDEENYDDSLLYKSQSFQNPLPLLNNLNKTINPFEDFFSFKFSNPEIDFVNLKQKEDLHIEYNEDMEIENCLSRFLKLDEQSFKKFKVEIKKQKENEKSLKMLENFSFKFLFGFHTLFYNLVNNKKDGEKMKKKNKNLKEEKMITGLLKILKQRKDEFLNKNSLLHNSFIVEYFTYLIYFIRKILDFSLFELSYYESLIINYYSSYSRNPLSLREFFYLAVKTKEDVNKDLIFQKNKKNNFWSENFNIIRIFGEIGRNTFFKNYTTWKTTENIEESCPNMQQINHFIPSVKRKRDVNYNLLVKSFD